MTSASTYESIPDVEQPDGNDADDYGIPTSDLIIKKAQERYPEAGTALEAEFLGRLDDAIDNAEPKIVIPRLSVKDLQPTSEMNDTMELIKSLKLPTVAFAVTVTTALIIVVSNSPIAQALFPYYACILTFMSSIPDIRKRFLAGVKPVFDNISTLKKNVESRVDGVSTKGLRYLSITETAMNQAITPIKDKLAFATKAQDMLRQTDPTIDIPDTTDIEEEFDSFQGQMKKAFTGMQDVVDLRRTFPEPLKSVEKFQIYVMVPFLAVMLGLQLWGVYTTAQRGSNKDVEDAILGTARFLVEDGSINLSNTTMIDGEWMLNATSETLAPTSSVVDEAADVSGDSDDNEWLNMRIAIQTYVTTVLQIVLAFIITQVRAMVLLINSQIGVLEGRVNKKLRIAVGDVFETIFKKGFGIVKEKFLTLIRKIDKIEGPINEIKSKIPGGGSLPGNLADKIPAKIPSVGGFLGKFGM